MVKLDLANSHYVRDAPKKIDVSLANYETLFEREVASKFDRLIASLLDAAGAGFMLQDEIHLRLAGKT